MIQYKKHLNKIYKIYVYMVGNSVYVLEDEGTLMAAPVKDSVAGKKTDTFVSVKSAAR